MNTPRVVTIRRRRAWDFSALGECWANRELLGVFVWKHIKVRYKQTVIGIAWALLQPLATMGLFSLVFGRLAGLPTDGAPAPVFYLSGLVIWTFFAQALTGATQSLVDQEAMLRKIYFPRALLPLSAVLAALFDLVWSALALAALLAWHGVSPTFLPAALLAIASAAMTAVAFGMPLAALNVAYRDVRHAIPFLMQIWMFASPVAYGASLVPATGRAWYALNPLVGSIELFRWAVGAASGPAPWRDAAIGMLVSTAVGLAGLIYFARVERSFADVI